MSKILIFMLLPVFLFSKSVLAVGSDCKDAFIYINGEKRGVVSDGYTDISVEEGDVNVRVEKRSDDGQWIYEGEKNIFVGKDTYTKLNIKTSKEQTEEYAKNVSEKTEQALDILSLNNQKEFEKIKNTFEDSGDHRFYRSSKNVVFDGKSKLLWADDLSSKRIIKNYTTAKMYCKKLVLAGFNDWRLPKVEELLSITDLYELKPASKKAFKNVANKFYWTDTNKFKNKTLIWVVGFSNGNSRWSKTNREYNVRCVR